MKLRALITGAAGFIGANLAYRLAGEGLETHLLVRPGSDLWRLQGCHTAFLHEVDLTQLKSLGALIDSIRPDWVFHLAAYGAYSSQTDLERMIAVNLAGTAHLLEACCQTGISAFIQAGSSSEYGLQDHPPLESELPAPNSPYAVTKLAATFYSGFVAAESRLPIRILRLYSIYGPFEDPMRLMPTLVGHALHGHLPPLVNPDTARDFVYIEDALDAFILTARAAHLARGEILNLGSGKQTTLHALVALTRELFGIREEPRWGSMPNRRWDTACWISHPQKIAHLLGWKPRITIAKGLRRLADWLRTHPEHNHFYTYG